MNRKNKHSNLQHRSGKLAHLTCLAASCLLSLFLVFQPLMLQAQEITVAPNAAAANRPGLGTAGNGVPFVNIVAPNASGLSHNRYDRFNVGRQGAILNNSDQRLENSQLGGLLQGNSNLVNSRTASVILNEVTGSNRSLLEGSLEVHGDRADVILANPNGVTCNGCGFINTPRVTLSTGLPGLDDTGSLASLSVERGDISIGSNGVGLDGVNVFDLISRRISISGPVNVLDELNLVAGRNSYAYQSGLVTSLASDGNEPDVAIDSSLLGGMYAGRIKIVSTELGAGVNTQGQMTTNAHGMTITADGKLTLGNVRAKGGITATSKADSVQITKTLFSEESVVLEGESEITLDGNASATSSGDVSLEAGTVSLGNAALVASGRSEDGTQNTVGDLTVEANRLNAGNGKLAAGNLLNVTASIINLDRATDDNTDVLRSLGSIVLNAGSILARNARITSLGALDLKSSSPIELTNGLYSATGNLLVEASGVTTGATLNSQGTVTLRGTIGIVTNTGRVTGDEGVIVSAATTFRNEGDLSSAKSVDITSLGAATNTATGGIVGSEGVTLNVASLNNFGEIEARGSNLTVNTGGNLENGRGSELSGSSAHLNVDGTLANNGKLDFTGALRIRGYNNTHSNALRNNRRGKMHSGSGHYSVASFRNRGSLKTRVAGLDIDAVGDVTNLRTIEAKTTGTIRLGGSLYNNRDSSSIVSEGALVITGRSGGHFGTLSNERGGALINGGASLSIKAASVTNRGKIGSADGNLLVELTGDADNTGVLYSGTSSVYALNGRLTNTGADIVAETDLTIKGLGSARAASIENSSGNIEAISGDLTLTANTITNKRSIIIFGTTSSTQTSVSGDVTTTTSTTRDIVEQNSAVSKMLAGGNITISADMLENNYSQIAANGNITITANTINNIGRDLIETVNTETETRGSRRFCTSSIFGICRRHEIRPWTTTEHASTLSIYDSVFASIKAGGTLNANVRGYTRNNAVRQGAGQIMLASGDRALDSVSVASGSD
ncbi:MAG: filamentous hemagglutinin N-terminal domain-containing protein [Hyphomicrobiales bacterium]|nr:filamentous hemagglutinin N-terminal domain-containing protein [Hyphomicrobiales bacterium]